MIVVWPGTDLVERECVASACRALVEGSGSRISCSAMRSARRPVVPGVSRMRRTCHPHVSGRARECDRCSYLDGDRRRREARAIVCNSRRCRRSTGVYIRSDTDRWFCRSCRCLIGRRIIGRVYCHRCPVIAQRCRSVRTLPPIKPSSDNDDCRHYQYPNVFPIKIAIL